MTLDDANNSPLNGCVGELAASRGGRRKSTSDTRWRREFEAQRVKYFCHSGSWPLLFSLTTSNNYSPPVSLAALLILTQRYIISSALTPSSLFSFRHSNALLLLSVLFRPFNKPLGPTYTTSNYILRPSCPTIRGILLLGLDMLSEHTFIKRNDQ